MAFGGRGIARRDGKVYFVSDTVEGDQVRARITEDKERYCSAVVTEFIKESELRTPPLCRFMTDCGGCQWMGIPYEKQLEWKGQFIQSALKRIGKVPADLQVEVRPSPDLLHYRNRVLIRVHVSEHGDLTCGYFMRGSRTLVAIDRCEIACEPVNRVISALKKMDLSGIQSIKVRLEIQELPHDSGQVAMTVYPGDGSREMTNAFTERLQALPHVVWAGRVFDLPQAPVLDFDQQHDRTFVTIPGQFQQVNVAHNQNLRSFIRDLVATRNPGRILDVFCGSGNLSIALADNVRYVEGIEANKVAIACAKKNSAANNVTNTLYLAGDAEKHMWKVSKSGEHFDLVILDPPRQGFYKGMVPLKNMRPKHIIYVSCDPTTLARDIGYLCRNDTYAITSVTGFDFFPNTYHVETVAVLERAENTSD